MKAFFKTLYFVMIALFSLFSCSAQESPKSLSTGKKMYIDVHQLEPGKVNFDDVASAHEQDLAVQGKHGVNFIHYLVDEAQGLIYCLSSAPDTGSIRAAHAEAHGLLPTYTFEVTEGEAETFSGDRPLFLDIHEVGPGNVTAAAVAEAHKKDLSVQGKYGVNFINYWVDEKRGVVLCLSEAKDPESIIETHKEAHGLIPQKVNAVKRGE